MTMPRSRALCLTMPSAIGLRQMLPMHTSSILFVAMLLSPDRSGVAKVCKEEGPLVGGPSLFER
jgi:hypothetical protein